MAADVEKAIDIAIGWGWVDGDHHKMWVIDQMLRALTGDQYDATIADYCNGENGPDTYAWDCGIAP